ncbi:MAG: hypothetical protein JWO57_2747 [Pseudonocardiales bacterium]|nr:hypothetical protein [Pseudonocardiales bacterium]
MHATRVAAALAVAIAFASADPAVAAPAAGSRVLFHLQDPRIDEASGIAVGITSPGVVYVHNDSGDSARFFALDARTGRTLVTYDVPGATNVDWEDIAVAPDERGVPSVWLADIGDNGASRAEIDIYRVDEPRVTRDGAAASTGRPDMWRLRYPDGPKDAESLAVTPGGAAFLFSKSLVGSTTAYALPARPDAAHVQSLRRVGAITFHFTKPAAPASAIGELAATGAALSRDGSLLVVRTYTDAYVWRVGSSGVAGALRSSPVRVALPAQPQGEGVTFDGRTLLVDSEHAGSAVYSVALPPHLVARVVATPTPRSSGVAHRPTAARDRPWLPAVAVAAAVIIAGTLFWTVPRRRRRRAASRPS